MSLFCSTAAVCCHNMQSNSEKKTVCGAEGAKPGDAVFLEGQAAGSSFPKTLKSDIWKKIVPDLQVHSSAACYAMRKLVTAAGDIYLPARMPDGAGIH